MINERPTGRWILIALAISMFIPAYPVIMGLRLDAFRIFALLAIIPLLVSTIADRQKRIGWVDVLITASLVWAVLSLLVHHGLDQLPYAGVTTLEALAGFLAGRQLIKTKADYRYFFGVLLVLLALLLPVSIYENLTSRLLVSEIMGKFLPVYEDFDDMRFGLARAQTVFPHPILFGMFCSMCVANYYYMYRRHPIRTGFSLFLPLALIGSALSSAPILATMLQAFLVLWHKIFVGRWKLLLSMVAGVYVILSLASNRGPIILMIDYLTLNPSTAWWRVHIWEYGSQSVYDHPLLGIGMNDWNRPHWLASTVDNFWLLIAMRHGIPAFVLLAAAISIHIAKITRAKINDAEITDVRNGYMIALTATLLTLCTVHVWSSMAFFFYLYLGAGTFMYRGLQVEETAAPATKITPPVQHHIRGVQPAKSATVFTRFPPRQNEMRMGPKRR